MQTQATEQQNQSIGSADVSFNRSFTDEDVKSSEQLLKIIKYLRQEKDISVSKCEILEAELLRLKSQHDLITKQLEDAKANLEAERQKSEVSMVTAAKHSEVLRKVETLNAITDSNRTLRQERDGLSSQISDLKARTALLEDQVAPLQEKNKDLSLKFDALHSENVSLRGEATRWRQRANMLIEKSNRTSPEDWKKLQNERENLAKQLAIEKGTSTKLGDDLNNVRHEKTKLEEQLRSLRSQNNQVSDDLEKTRSDLAKVREQVTELTHSLDETKENYSKLLEEKNKIEADMTNKGEVIVDLKNNLLAVRKIAKKYKQQCEDLTGTMDALKQENEERNKNEATAAEKQQQTLAEERTLMQERISLLEVNHNEKVEQLTQQISAANEEISNHQKEIESLKQSAVEKDDRFKSIFKNAKERLITLTEENNTLRSERSRSSDDSSDKGKNSEVEKLMKEKEEILQEKQLEKDRLMSEIETLTQRVNQLQRQLGQQGSKPTTSSGTSEKSTSEPPTANIKPMAGHSTNTQTHSVQIQPWRSGPETPLASIRPMSMQVRTAAVLPTSQGPSTSQSPSAVMVPPQQQVHTTGPSNIESLSSSPTSSHTEYMPATSSATPTVVTPRQLAVPPTQSTQDVEDDDSTLQPVLQQQAVALVLPRVEQPSNGPAQELGTSSSSSNTVTTTQAGLKRPRDVDAEACQIDDQSKQQQSKRTRIQQGSTETSQHHGTVTDSGLEVEYQVPTSSQRDHEEDHDAVIVVDESEDDVDDPDEGEGDDNVGDDPDTEGYDMESYPEQELSYDDADCQDMEEVEGGNEVEVVEGSSEVPNQSERSIQENSSQEESLEQPQSETISSGTDGLSNVTVSQASPSVAVTMPSFSRTRSVAPLTRQQPQSHLLLQHGMDEGGDDGTGRSVPSTPLQTSPQESGPAGEEHSSQQSTSSEPEIPVITVSGVSDEGESEGGMPESMGPPSTVGETSEASEQREDVRENEDGVTSEGEKPPISEESEEEGREAEASPSTNTRSRSNNVHRGGGVARRSGKYGSPMHGGIPRPNPTPIVWGDQHSGRHQLAPRGRGNQGNFSRVAKRGRVRGSSRPYNRF
ncbi:nucleoprotein TPR-like isoform X3 [Photinus pyralis]|uniref:nucleoprotein TPR-like isoform X3 n=1 Tax=Photinus pyralis TaxID=7054 RepID=UPI0012674375|nr:nucleoprotein TPR-like isoform X3 [Photinus pyralis]